MRVDQYLVQEGFYETRNKAQEALKNGLVLIDGKTAKPSLEVEFCTVEVLVQSDISRSASKLRGFIEHHSISFDGLTMMDVGASTGGFTSVAIEFGANLVYAVDVGTEQLHPSLKNHSKVISMEQTNILDVEFNTLKPIDFVVMDVSFVSIKKILPTLFKQTKELIVLIKPQFETGGKHLTKGVVKSQRIIKDVLDDMNNFVQSYQKEIVILEKSITKGKEGNQEFLAYIK